MGTPDLTDRAADPTLEDQSQRRGRVDRRMILPLVVILVIAGGFAVILQSTSSTPLPDGAQRSNSAGLEGPRFPSLSPAPPLALRNYLGQRVNIDQYRGKAVLVTFLYTHCPDVCPLIAANLRVAQNLMGAKTAAKAQIIAVSVDPHGDNPQTVAAFLKVHGMTGRMQYLIGSARELGRVWEAWGVGSQQDAQQPELVNHTALIYGISASGKRTTIYPANFKPSEIAHDVPLLASH